MKVLRAAPEVQCVDSDWNFYMVKTFGYIGFVNILLIFLFILKTLRR